MTGMRVSTLSEANHCADHREFAIRFALWCNGLAGVPTADRIRVKWGMSRATAYRWRRAWCDAIGIDPPPPPRPVKVNPADIMRARKASAGLVKSKANGSACRDCEFFHMRAGAPWGKCRKHAFPVQPGQVCKQFTTRDP